MKRIVVLLVLGACEGGQSPSSENIRIARLECAPDPDTLRFEVQIEATLDDGQAVRVTFLTDIEDVQFSRTTSWDCMAWSQVGDGCARDAGQSEDTQTITGAEINVVNIGTLPDTFEYTTAVSITSIEGLDVESVLLTDDC